MEKSKTSNGITPKFSSNANSHLWTILSSGMFSAGATLLIFIAARVVGVEQSGLLSFSIAVAELFRFAITFGMRNLHATDVAKIYTFSDYFQLRVITAGAAILLAIIGVLAFAADKKAIIILYFLFVLTDAFSDVFEGELQRNGKMYRAGQLRFFRIFVGFCAFCVIIFAAKNLLFAVLGYVFSSLFVTVIAVFLLRKNFGAIHIKFEIATLKNLARESFPLFFSAILMMYLMQAQKYFLGAFGTDADVAIYTYLVTPTYLIAMFSSFIFFGPVLTYVATLFNNGEYDKFSRRVNLQLLIILGLSVVVIGALGLFGVPILSWIYGVDLTEYSVQFVIMLIAGSVVPLASLLGNMLVVMRKQLLYLAGYVGVALISTAVMLPLVAKFNIVGAAWSGIIVYPLLAVWFFICYKTQLNKYKKEREI